MQLLCKPSTVLTALDQGAAKRETLAGTEGWGYIDGHILDMVWEELRDCIQISRCSCLFSFQIALLKPTPLRLSSLHKTLRIQFILLTLVFKALCDLAC